MAPPSRWLRAHRWDAALSLLGIALGLPSLLFPFGRDQGLYFYVGREWILRGAIPYRDTFDHKTPGIYVIHALSVALFGQEMWGIRVLELMAVVGFGLAAGSCQAPAGRRIPDGRRGLTVALGSLFLFGFFDYWGTAQTELWYSGFGICAVWTATRAARLSRASFWAGSWLGAALCMKPPSIFFGVVAGLVLLDRARHELRPARACALVCLRFGAGAALVPGLTLAYFAANHALGAMIEIVVRANAYYITHEHLNAPGWTWREHTWAILDFYEPFWFLLPIGLASLVAPLPGPRPAEAARATATALGLLGAAILGVVMQGKFYGLHWGSLCLPAGLVGCLALRGFARFLPRLAALPVLATGVVVAYVHTGALPRYRVAALHAAVIRDEWAYLRGEITRAELDERDFSAPSGGFWAHHSRRVGEWLRAHTTPDETIAVRGFQPEIYAIAHRRHAGRFFWTVFLTAESRRYNREAWLAEDRRALETNPPKYVVTLAFVHEGPESTEWFAELGYHPVAQMDELTILER